MEGDGGVDKDFGEGREGGDVLQKGALTVGDLFEARRGEATKRK